VLYGTYAYVVVADDHKTNYDDRNIDRVLTSSVPTSNGALSYEDHGLLICEVHTVHQMARSVFPGVLYRDFQEDMSDLTDINAGVEKQLKVLERIRWTYSKWLQ